MTPFCIKFVSILHKYDYDYLTYSLTQTLSSFQFYISTIMIPGIKCKVTKADSVSILHKYDYDDSDIAA